MTVLVMPFPKLVIGVLDFVRYIDGKLLVSVANCPGIYDAATPWAQVAGQAKLLFDFSRDYGAPIDAAEFTNEPNMISLSSLPDGYTAEDFSRDHNLFGQWLRKNYPGILFVGPCSTDGDPEGKTGDTGAGLGIAFNIVHIPDLMGPIGINELSVSPSSVLPLRAEIRKVLLRHAP